MSDFKPTSDDLFDSSVQATNSDDQGANFITGIIALNSASAFGIDVKPTALKQHTASAARNNLETAVSYKVSGATADKSTLKFDKLPTYLASEFSGAVLSKAVKNTQTVFGKLNALDDAGKIAALQLLQANAGKGENIGGKFNAGDVTTYTKDNFGAPNSIMKLIATANNPQQNAVKDLFTGSSRFYDLGTDGTGIAGGRNFVCKDSKLTEKTASGSNAAVKNAVVNNIADAKIFVPGTLVAEGACMTIDTKTGIAAIKAVYAALGAETLTVFDAANTDVQTAVKSVGADSTTSLMSKDITKDDFAKYTAEEKAYFTAAVTLAKTGEVTVDNVVAVMNEETPKTVTAENLKTNGLKVALNTQIMDFVVKNFKKADLVKGTGDVYMCDETKLTDDTELKSCQTNLKKLSDEVCVKTQADKTCEKNLDKYVDTIIWSDKTVSAKTPFDNCQASNTGDTCFTVLDTSPVLDSTTLFTSQTDALTHCYPGLDGSATYCPAEPAVSDEL